MWPASLNQILFRKIIKSNFQQIKSWRIKLKKKIIKMIKELAVKRIKVKIEIKNKLKDN